MCMARLKFSQVVNFSVCINFLFSTSKLAVLFFSIGTDSILN